MKKRIHGITLIALIITIIVLLILASVSIATLVGENGIITKTNESKTQTEKASTQEKIQLEVIGAYTENNGKLDYGILKNNLETNIKATVSAKNNDNNFPIITNLDGYEFQITEEGKVKSTEGMPDLEITTVAELQEFSEKVKAGDTFEGKTVALMNDIDLRGIAWDPIGTSSNSFSGTLDGNNHSISNLSMSGTNDKGLFTTNRGTIKNLTMTSPSFSSSVKEEETSGAHYIGDVRCCCC